MRCHCRMHACMHAPCSHARRCCVRGRACRLKHAAPLTQRADAACGPLARLVDRKPKVAQGEATILVKKYVFGPAWVHSCALVSNGSKAGTPAPVARSIAFKGQQQHQQHKKQQQQKQQGAAAPCSLDVPVDVAQRVELDKHLQQRRNHLACMLREKDSVRRGPGANRPMCAGNQVQTHSQLQRAAASWAPLGHRSAA